MSGASVSGTDVWGLFFWDRCLGPLFVGPMSGASVCGTNVWGLCLWDQCLGPLLVAPMSVGSLFCGSVYVPQHGLQPYADMTVRTRALPRLQQGGEPEEDGGADGAPQAGGEGPGHSGASPECEVSQPAMGAAVVRDPRAPLVRYPRAPLMRYPLVHLPADAPPIGAPAR